MTGFEILAKWFGLGAGTIRAALVAGAAAAPDAAATLNQLIAELDAAGDPARLAAVAALLSSEVKDILGGNLKPRNHASDAG